MIIQELCVEEHFKKYNWPCFLPSLPYALISQQKKEDKENFYKINAIKFSCNQVYNFLVKLFTTHSINTSVVTSRFSIMTESTFQSLRKFNIYQVLLGLKYNLWKEYEETDKEMQRRNLFAIHVLENRTRKPGPRRAQLFLVPGYWTWMKPHEITVLSSSVRKKKKKLTLEPKEN